MPMPVSLTSTTSGPPFTSRRTASVMLPPGRLYSTALCSRLIITSRSLSASVTTDGVGGKSVFRVSPCDSASGRMTATHPVANSVASVGVEVILVCPASR